MAATARAATGSHNWVADNLVLVNRAPTAKAAAMRTTNDAPSSGVASNVGTNCTRWMTAIPMRARIPVARITASATAEADELTGGLGRLPLGRVNAVIGIDPFVVG